jgi:hypothetical protein
MEYTADGDKLSVVIPPEGKEEGLESTEFFFEDDALCMEMKMGGGTMKFIFRRP